MAKDLFGENEPDQEEVLSIVEQAQREVKYLISDMPVELINGKFNLAEQKDGDIYIPEYQRNLRWDRDAMSFFIESLLLRIPIPPIFFYENRGKLEIVDGSQRIRTLVMFVSGEFALTGLERLEILNGLGFRDLPEITRRKFLNTPIRTFILEQDTDGTTRYEMFRRINTSSKRLDDAEIRRGAFQGPFLDLVSKCSEKLEFRLLINPNASQKNTRRDEAVERLELVTRFFIYVNHYKEFTHDVRKFLDEKFQNYNRTLNPSIAKDMEYEFDQMVDFYRRQLPSAFRKTREGSIAPRVRFEALSVGVALALRTDPTAKPRDFDWINIEPFTSLIRTDASNSGPKLRGRIEFVRDRILENGSS